jgi:hypothetical protein
MNAYIVRPNRLLLTKTHFFQHFYPETEGCEGYHRFGFKRKGQLADPSRGLPVCCGTLGAFIDADRRADLR